MIFDQLFYFIQKLQLNALFLIIIILNKELNSKIVLKIHLKNLLKILIIQYDFIFALYLCRAFIFIGIIVRLIFVYYFIFIFFFVIFML